MKFTISAKQMEVADDLRQYTEKKVGKIDRLFRSESEAFVTFSRERGRYTAEVTLKNNGMFYRVSATTGGRRTAAATTGGEHGGASSCSGEGQERPTIEVTHEVILLSV